MYQFREISYKMPKGSVRATENDLTSKLDRIIPETHWTQYGLTSEGQF